MALTAPSESPAIVVKEVDLTSGVPNIPTSTGAMVGNFSWGPCDIPTLVSNEATLVGTFGSPDTVNTGDFHAANQFLRYSDDLYIVREYTDTAKNSYETTAGAATYTGLTHASISGAAGASATGTGAVWTVVKSGGVYSAALTNEGTGGDYNVGDSAVILGTSLGGATPANDLKIIITGEDSAGGTGIVDIGTFTTSGTPVAGSGSIPLVTNTDNFDGQKAQLGTDGHTFVAKYPGVLGNSLKVSMVGASATDSDFTNWTYRSYFDAAPETSSFANTASAGASTNVTNDEVHVAIIDEEGEVSGIAGTVLETFPFVSLILGAKTNQGSTNYIQEVLNRNSQYVWLPSVNDSRFGTNVGTAPTGTKNFAASFGTGSKKELTISLGGGVNSAALAAADFGTGFAKFNDPNALAIDFMIAPGLATAQNHQTVVNNMVSIAQNTRKDCMVLASPNREAVVGKQTSALAVTAITAAQSSHQFTRSSYLAVDNNYLKVYDKYNDQYIFIPAASSTAGIMAATDNNFAPWFSPAGTRRGQYFGVTSLAYSPTKSERDTLYKAGINPIANIPGQGVLLYGDKTHLARPSAFDRINVRRLFLVLERAISAAAQNILFEFNDEFTRAEFVNIVEPLLRDVKGRRGITDFKLVCDETNNTPLIIDSNQFIASLFIKPARSINFITLNFVAVRTGVSFEEVVGTSGV
jgi:hypothetical protein|tara:strand:+ start:8336 stop:10420 length:2085 start_codon:yes stop_codon:yes gene_type:complete